MKEIQLTQGKIALVDDGDYEKLNQFKWYTIKIRSLFYAARERQNKTILMHRIIINAPERLYTDHINGNPLDNRKINLRL